MKKDALYVNLKSEKDNEKKQLEARINTIDSQIAKLQIECTRLHSECAKKDTLYESLRSESYNEKERLNAQIEKMTKNQPTSEKFYKDALQGVLLSDDQNQASSDHPRS